MRFLQGFGFRDIIYDSLWNRSQSLQRCVCVWVCTHSMLAAVMLFNTMVFSAHRFVPPRAFSSLVPRVFPFTLRYLLTSSWTWERHTSAHWSTVHTHTHTHWSTVHTHTHTHTHTLKYCSLTHTHTHTEVLFTHSLTHTHTHSTISASQSPLRWFIRDESVSIFVTFHFLTSSGVATREAEPKTCSTPSDSPPGYAWGAGHTRLNGNTVIDSRSSSVQVCIFYLHEFVQDDPLVAPVVNSIGHRLQVVLQRLDAQTGIKLRPVVCKRKHVTVHLSLQDLSHSACCFYRNTQIQLQICHACSFNEKKKIYILGGTTVFNSKSAY